MEESRGLRMSETSLRLDAACASLATSPYIDASLMTLDTSKQPVNASSRLSRSTGRLLT